jgi:hypothetical protein
VTPEVLGRHALNRALLERQGLLRRSRAGPLDMIERLVGMQAQEPQNPYLALWSRLERFDPESLSELIAERRAVRAQLMRATIHLVIARDCLGMHPFAQPLRSRVFRTAFGRMLEGIDVGEIVEEGRALVSEQPRSRAELRPCLTRRWPDADPNALAQAVTFNLPLVQVPPRGLWRRSGQARWALAELWLGAPLDPDPPAEQLVLRYLAAFGPASTGDIRTWSGVSGLREVVERLRPRLRTFRDERGRELLDVPGAPLPDPDTPPPPRFLPEFDNVTLSHEDRSRIVEHPGAYPAGPGLRGSLLIDGFYSAHWRLTDRALELIGAAPDDELEAEARRLLAFLDAEDAGVVFTARS